VRNRIERPRRESDVVEDVQDRRVDGVATKVALEVGVRFEQGRRNGLARQQQRQEHAGRSATNHTACRRVDISNLVRLGGRMHLPLCLVPHVNRHGIPLRYGTGLDRVPQASVSGVTAWAPSWSGRNA
jgi:hypothetical protein